MLLLKVIGALYPQLYHYKYAKINLNLYIRLQFSIKNIPAKLTLAEISILKNVMKTEKYNFHQNHIYNPINFFLNIFKKYHNLSRKQ